jgi:tetratricopeptide (TPR) repeat protein
MKHLGAMTALTILLFCFCVLFAFNVQATEPFESEFRKTFQSFAEKERNNPYWLSKKVRGIMADGTIEVSTVLLEGVAKLAMGDVEGFSRSLKKTKRMRFYKYEAAPLTQVQGFVNEILNTMRDRNGILSRIKMTPRSAFNHFQMGVLYRNISVGESVVFLRNALRLNPKYYDAHLKLAEAYEEMMDWERAEEVWERVVVLRPEDYRPFLKVAHMRMRRGDFQGAENWYREGLTKRLYEKHYKAFRQIVTELMDNIPQMRSQREVELKKIQTLRQSLKTTPNDTLSINEISRLFLEVIGDIRSAEMWSQRCLNYDDTDWNAYLRLFDIYHRLGRNREAMENLISAMHEGPKKIFDGYRNELKRTVEKTLLLDLVAGKPRMNEIVDYFSMYYQ